VHLALSICFFLILTFLPLDAHDVSDVAVDGVIGQEAGGGGGGAGQADLGVDVEGQGGAAGRPDGRGEGDVIGDEVVAGHGAVEVGLRGDLLGF
jgi:hypothetical protein